MSRWHVNNLLAHVCAAALIVDDYEVDVNDLRDDLRIENREYVVVFLYPVTWPFRLTDIPKASGSSLWSWAADSHSPRKRNAGG